MSQSDASLVTLSSPPRLVDIQSSPTLEARKARRAAGPLDPLFFSSSPTPPPPPKRRPVKRAPTEHQRWREANRVRRRRADTMRDLIVHMDTGLAEELWSDIYVQIRARLQDDEATLRLVPRRAPMSRLVFERKVRSTYDPIQQLWEPLADEQIVREPTLVFVAAARHILDSTNDEVLAQMDECEQRILLIMGLESLLRQVRTRQNRDYAHSIRQRMQGHASDVQMPNDDTRERIERRLLQLQLEHQCHIVRLEKQEEAVEWVHALASDISIRPYKRIQSEAPPRRVAKAADDGLPAYRAMLEEIPRCTSQASAVISAQYPSLASLVQALEQDGPDVLADLVSDGGRPTRRLGPQLSRRIHAAFTSRDPKASAE